MTTTENTKPSPIEVWLRQTNMEIACTVVYEDEATTSLDIDSLSMRGAQREVTGYYISNGYTPVGRWEEEEVIGGYDGVETVRRFRLAKETS